MDLNIFWYLVPSVIMFAAGVYGFITRKNMIAMLISLELILNSADLNFVVFNRYLSRVPMEGMIFTLFAIAIAAARDGYRDLDYHQIIYREVGNSDVASVKQMRF